MKAFNRFFSALLILVLFAACNTSKQVGHKETSEQIKPTLILVSFDGCRYDYPDHCDTPNLDAIAANGVKAEGLKTSFPSKTFPNHITIVTGLYPGNHGIIANKIYDHNTGEYYKLSNKAVTEAKWYNGEPIWVTAELQGFKTATFFWPGSEAPIKGVRPTYWKAYEHTFPYEKRVERVLNWLDLPEEERPQFISLYFDEPDGQGHRHGPLSKEALSALEEVDGHLGDLLKGLKERGLEDKVNIIVLSDHGMTTVSRDRLIYLDDYIDLNDVLVVDWSPIAAIRPKPGKEEKVYNALKGAHPHMKVYKKGELPEEYHYNDYKFIQPIIIVADLGWTMGSHQFYGKKPGKPSGGTHGYDPNYTEMNAIFYAQGPAFKKGYTAPVFQNIHVYELMCAVLGLEPAQNDGDIKEVKELLER